MVSNLMQKIEGRGKKKKNFHLSFCKIPRRGFLPHVLALHLCFNYCEFWLKSCWEAAEDSAVCWMCAGLGLHTPTCLSSLCDL